MYSWIQHLFLLSLFNLVYKGFSQTTKPIQNSCPPFIVHGESKLERVEESVYPNGWIVCRREMGAESACLFREKFGSITHCISIGPSENSVCCVPKGCVRAAQEVKARMDLSIDPCNDFYTFACGGFDDKAVIPEYKGRYTTFTEIQDKLQEQIRKLLEESISESDPKPYKLAKTFYISCLDEDSIEALGLTPLKKRLDNLGGWPLINEGWNEEEFNIWHEFMPKLQKNNLKWYSILDMTVSRNVKNSSWLALELAQPSPDVEFIKHFNLIL